ncbi:DUF6124 family protein [Pseudomonas paralactis]|nr:hypothetical protein [Pseudomonas paralactis]
MGKTETSYKAFDLDGSRREGALGIAQLIEVSRLLAERVLADIER